MVSFSTLEEVVIKLMDLRLAVEGIHKAQCFPVYSASIKQNRENTTEILTDTINFNIEGEQRVVLQELAANTPIFFQKRRKEQQKADKY